MRFESKAMPTPASVASGASIVVDRFTEKTVIVSGTFDATVRVQGSLDGSTWADLTGDITAPGVHPIPHTVRHLRMRTTVFASGAPAASFGGFDGRAF